MVSSEPRLLLDYKQYAQRNAEGDRDHSKDIIYTRCLGNENARIYPSCDDGKAEGAEDDRDDDQGRPLRNRIDVVGFGPAFDN